MANNRLYLVDVSTGEYLCIAKGDGCLWSTGNIDLYREFIENRANECGDKTSLIIGSENDNSFYDQFIINGIDYNQENVWE